MNHKSKVKQRLQQNDFTQIDGKVLVAVSSGVDSMALLYQLIDANIEVGIIYVNHLQRQQAEMEEQYLRELAATKQLPFFSCSINPYDAKKGHGNKQQYFRNERYRLILETAKRNNYEHIATAHHADDQVESYIFRLISGFERDRMGKIATNKDLHAINLHRPLLHWYKDELYAYCEMNQITFYEDESNKEVVYARNRLRKNVIPELEQIDRQAKQHVQHFFKDYETLVTYQKEQMTSIITAHETWHQGIKVIKRNVIEEYLTEQPTFIAILMIEVLLTKYFNLSIDLPRHLLQEIENKIKSNHSIGVSLTSHLRLEEQYGYLYILDTTPEQSIKLPVETQKIKQYSLYVTDEPQQNNGVQFALTSEFPLENLEIRNAQTKDEIAILGGTKRIRKLHKDDKILLPRRKEALVLAIKDSDEVLYDFSTKKLSQKLIDSEANKSKYISWEMIPNLE